MKCIATFHSHYGAMAFKKAIEQRGFSVTLMPVPRHLSSSCGTCARFEVPEGFSMPDTPELDMIYREDDR